MRKIGWLAAALVLALGPSLAARANCLPDSIGSGVSTITDPTFGAYTVEKSFEVFADNNCGNPQPVPGNYTFVYRLTVQPSSTIGILNFQVPVPNAGAVTAKGFLDGAGVEPTGITQLSTSVVFSFAPAGINPGQVSEDLYIVTPYAPGTATVSIGGQFGLDATGTCLGPVVAPEPVGCTIGFWKNRQEGKQGLLKYFPDGDFSAVKAQAVAISSVFSTQTELVTALTSKGPRSVEERAKQQLAALLLNVAAGQLYPANTKCRLFLGASGTQIDTNGDGTPDMTLEAALTLIESNILSGDPALQQQALNLADDINNGIGVKQSTMFN
jgi:hypothetical protein